MRLIKAGPTCCFDGVDSETLIFQMCLQDNRPHVNSLIVYGSNVKNI